MQARPREDKEITRVIFLISLLILSSKINLKRDEQEDHLTVERAKREEPEIIRKR
ncbi:unnamed protein product, partial [Didymodactylos carnosus]